MGSRGAAWSSDIKEFFVTPSRSSLRSPTLTAFFMCPTARLCSCCLYQVVSESLIPRNQNVERQ